MAENMSKMAAILNFTMAATRGREYVGGIFFQLPLDGSTPVQSFMLASKTERFWCFAALLIENNLA